MLYKAQFPESIYVPSREDSIAIYEDRIIRGEKIMSSLDVFIFALARNVEKVFEYSKARIEQLQSMFNTAEILVVENDSTDRTKELLRKWSDENDYFDFISSDYGHPKLADKSLERRKIMAQHRNKYLNYVDERLLEYDYVRATHAIIVDFDIPGGFSYNGVANSFGFEQDWSCISGNSLIYRENDGKLESLFYDTWAKRNYGSWEEICGPAGNKQLYNVGDEPVPVYSNFGGIAIYKLNDIIDLRYNESDCDHVTLNKQLIERGKNIYLNPSMITLQTPTYISRKLCNNN